MPKLSNTQMKLSETSKLSRANTKRKCSRADTKQKFSGRIQSENVPWRVQSENFPGRAHAKSTTTATTKQYKTYLLRWEKFCYREQIDVFTPGLAKAIEFLTELYNSTIGHSAINTAHSALYFQTMVSNLEKILLSADFRKVFLS